MKYEIRSRSKTFDWFVVLKAKPENKCTILMNVVNLFIVKTYRYKRKITGNSQLFDNEISIFKKLFQATKQCRQIVRIING